MAVAAILAVLDWTAVTVRSRVLERCAKPAVLLALLAAALTAHPRHAGVHGWLVLALCFGLVGDIALSFASESQLTPRGSEQAGGDSVGGEQVEVTARAPGGAHRAPSADRGWRAELAEHGDRGAVVGTATAGPDLLFSAGLGSFLLGHLCYCVAMLRYGTDQLSLGFGLVLVLLALLAFGQKVLTGAQSEGGTALTVAVAAYITVLGSTVVLGIGTADLWVAYGIVLFAFSDLMLATDRFVRRLSWAPVTVAVSYHLAQALLVLGLTR
ncbi:MAG: lysoplasmalogenase [Actinobacteria bacterium]|nr:lysoplasmalogenase [Actinomycetota bacterium]